MLKQTQHPIIYVLWPGENGAKPERVSSTRSLAMLMGGPYKALSFEPYHQEARTEYCRITGHASGKVGFCVRRDGEWMSRPSDHEHTALQNDAQRFARDRRMTPAIVGKQ